MGLHGLVQGYLYFLLFLEYAIRKVQENQARLKLNGTHQLLVYADAVSLPGDKYRYCHVLAV
jgi:hypothetical protein